jgi:hypothetical protein
VVGVNSCDAVVDLKRILLNANKIARSRLWG